eukprot:scaffold126012_cov17-Prasinocladus_malaysianus.AAC.1
MNWSFAKRLGRSYNVENSLAWVSASCLAWTGALLRVCGPEPWPRAARGPPGGPAGPSGGGPGRCWWPSGAPRGTAAGPRRSPRPPGG